MTKAKRTATPRLTVCPGQPSVRDIEDQISSDKRRAAIRKRKEARRLSEPRAEFSRRFAMRYGMGNNPAQLSPEDATRIRTHPQFLEPVGCRPADRLFVLESSAALE